MCQVLYCKGAAVDNTLGFGHEGTKSFVIKLGSVSEQQRWQNWSRAVYLTFSNTSHVRSMRNVRLNSTQSQSWDDKYSLTRTRSSSLSAAASYFFAPTKLVPWSELSLRTFSLWLMKCLKAFRNESIVMALRVSRCIVREARQVNNITHRFSSFHPSLL